MTIIRSENGSAPPLGATGAPPPIGAPRPRPVEPQHAMIPAPYRPIQLPDGLPDLPIEARLPLNLPEERPLHQPERRPNPNLWR